MAPVESTWHSAEILQDLLKTKRPCMEILWTLWESCGHPLELVWNLM
jgi:hypothetical protein